MITSEQRTSVVSRIQELVSQQWPESVYIGGVTQNESFPVTNAALQPLFPTTGIPAGQLIEITGGVSCGKTTVLLQLLAEIAARASVLYIDFGQTFFPPAGAAAGVPAGKTLLLRPESVNAGMRAAELQLSQGIVQCVVFDLVDRNEKISQILLHRLRQLVLKSNSVALFLTDNTVRLLPASLIALQLTVTRPSNEAIEIVTTKSRLTREGTKAKLPIC
jgi:recombination protein RecA